MHELLWLTAAELGLNPDRDADVFQLWRALTDRLRPFVESYDALLMANHGVVTYGADMRLFVDEGNTPCVMYGPGDVRRAHAADEYAEVRERLEQMETQREDLETAIRNTRQLIDGLSNLIAEQFRETFPGYGLVDLGVTYRVPVWNTVSPWIKVEVLNALDNQKAIAWDTTIAPDPTSALDASGLPTGYVTGPRYGEATSTAHYPRPRGGLTGVIVRHFGCLA